MTTVHSTADTDTAATERAAVSPNSVELCDLTSWAEALFTGVLTTLPEDRMSDAARVHWDAAHAVLSRDPDADALSQRFGYVLALDALAATPEAVTAAIVALRRRLVAADPALALLK